jgi:hypothetical protein
MLVRGLAAAAVALTVASLAATAEGQRPPRGILDPAGGGVRVVYAVGAASVRCSFGRSRGVPRLACSLRRRDGRSPERDFAATMDAGRVALFRVRAGRRTRLAAWSQQTGAPAYGAFRREPHASVIRLHRVASIGFLGTNIGCVAVGDGRAPGIRCLAHGTGGLPGPCCGPNFPLLVGSHGFFLSTRRMQALLVVDDGVTEVPNGGVARSAPPYRVIAEWRRR